MDLVQHTLLAIFAGAVALPITQGNIIMMGPGYHSITDLFRTGMVLGLTAWALWALAAIFYLPLVGLR